MLDFQTPKKIGRFLQIHIMSLQKKQKIMISSPLFFKSRQNHIPSWWLSFNPFEKYYIVKLDHLPNFSGWK